MSSNYPGLEKTCSQAQEVVESKQHRCEALVTAEQTQENSIFKCFN